MNSFVYRENRVPYYQRLFQEGQKKHIRQWNQVRYNLPSRFPDLTAGGRIGRLIRNIDSTRSCYVESILHCLHRLWCRYVDKGTSATELSANV